MLSALAGVLMVGHSLISPAQPQMLQQLLAARGIDAPVAAQIINGAPLIWNWTHGGEAEVDARAELATGRYDTLILTEAIPLQNHLDWSETPDHVARYGTLAHEANPAAQVYLLETWHSLNSGTGIAIEHDARGDVPWRQRLDDDWPLWQGVVRDSGINAIVIPAGQAMAALADAISAGDVPGLDSIGDVFADDIHPNDVGHYFVSLVTFAAITGQDPVGLPFELNDRWGAPFDAPGADLAARLQRIAGDTVARIANVTLGSGAAPDSPRAPPAPTAAPDRTPENRTGGIGIGLSGVNDWSVQQPFIDVMKTARPWLGHRPGQFGGMGVEDLEAAGLLDDAGWPRAIPRTLSSIGTLILTDLPEAAITMAGRYVLRFDGTGIVEVQGRVSNVRYGPGEVRFDYAPGPGPVQIRIQRTDPNRTGDHVRNITVMQERHADAYADGARFNPDWLALLDGMTVLRFMDWMATNGSTQSTWAERPRVSDMTYARKGVPVEVMIDLANTVGADPWVNMPHLADDDYVRRFATAMRDGLNPDLRVMVEFSNEVWNWQFTQTAWADAQATERWGVADAGYQYYGMRAAEVARMWSSILPEDRLINVVSTQTGWLGLEDPILNAPLFTGEAPDNAAPHTAFDAYAVSGYFGGILGTEADAETVRGWLADSLAMARDAAARLPEDERAAHIAAHRFDHASALAGRDLLDGSVSGHPDAALPDLTDRLWPYHKGVADRYGLELVIYEGGSHVVGIGAMVDDAAMTDFLIHFNYTPEMAALYERLLAAWADLDAGVFTHYSDVYAPTKWGSWGARRHLLDDNPRWRALTGPK